MSVLCRFMGIIVIYHGVLITGNSILFHRFSASFAFYEENPPASHWQTPFTKGQWWKTFLWLDIIMVNQRKWWRHRMETFSALLATCAGNSPVTGEFPSKRQVTRSFDVFFDLRLNKRLSKQSRGWWFETLPRSLWRHSNGISIC